MSITLSRTKPRSSGTPSGEHAATIASISGLWSCACHSTDWTASQSGTSRSLPPSSASSIWRNSMLPPAMPSVPSHERNCPSTKSSCCPMPCTMNSSWCSSLHAASSLRMSACWVRGETVAAAPAGCVAASYGTSAAISAHSGRLSACGRLENRPSTRASVDGDGDDANSASASPAEASCVAGGRFKLTRRATTTEPSVRTCSDAPTCCRLFTATAELVISSGWLSACDRLENRSSTRALVDGEANSASASSAGVAIFLPRRRVGNIVGLRIRVMFDYVQKHTTKS